VCFPDENLFVCFLTFHRDDPRHLNCLAYDQIEKDVNRTFPDLHFTPTGHEFQASLRRLLRAYAVRNPALGYCQSMNFIAGGLLIFMDEEQSFWMLCWIVENLLNGYFTEKMVGLQVDTIIFEQLMKQYLPEINDHLRNIGFNFILCTVQWFLCLFMNSVPSETAFRIWDMVFYCGTKPLLEAALNIMRHYESEIFRRSDPVDIVSFLSRSLPAIFDPTFLVANDILKGVTSSKIRKMQEEVLRDVKDEMRSRHDTLQMIELRRLTRFTLNELAGLYVQFLKLDPMLQEFGIHKDIFKMVIANVFPSWRPPDDHFVRRLFDAFDEDRDSLLDFKELMCGLSAVCRGPIKRKLHVCWRMFNATNAPAITWKEIRPLLFSIYKTVDTLPEKEIWRDVDFFSNHFLKDGKTEEDDICPTEFNEFALLQPAIVKCFHMNQPNYLTTISLCKNV